MTMDIKATLAQAIDAAKKGKILDVPLSKLCKDALREIESLESTIERILELVAWEAEQQGELANRFADKLRGIRVLLNAPKGKDS